MAMAALWLSVLSCSDRPVPAAQSGGDLQSGLPARAVELKVGDPAPPFTLPGSDGKVYSLTSYKGRQPVVLAWFAKAFSSA